MLVRVGPIEIDQWNRRVVGVIRTDKPRTRWRRRWYRRSGSTPCFVVSIRFSTTAVGMLLPCSAMSRVRGIAPRLGHEPVALHHSVVERGVGVGVALVQPVEGEERRRAVRLVPVGRQDGAVLAVGQGDRRAVRQPDGWELRVRGGKRRVSVVRSVSSKRLASDSRRSPLSSSTCSCWRYSSSRKPLTASAGTLRHPIPHPSRAEPSGAPG